MAQTLRSTRDKVFCQCFRDIGREKPGMGIGKSVKLRVQCLQHVRMRMARQDTAARLEASMKVFPSASVKRSPDAVLAWRGGV